MNEDLVRIIVIPVGILIFVFLFELFATQAKGVQDGRRKFKVWLREPGNIFPDAPKNLDEIREYVQFENQSNRKKIVDIVELVSWDSYTGLGFDLVAAALTCDILATFRASDVGVTIPNLTGWQVIHLLTLAFVANLVRANNIAKPQEETQSKNRVPKQNRSQFFTTIIDIFSIGERRRTITAILLGLFSLITSLYVFWKAL